MTKRFLCSIEAVKPNSVIRVDLASGQSIAVYNLRGVFYASDLLCTHGDASLAEGEIDGDQIVCPYHGGSFNIRTGDPVAPPCIVPLRIFQVSAEKDELFIETE